MYHLLFNNIIQGQTKLPHHMSHLDSYRPNGAPRSHTIQFTLIITLVVFLFVLKLKMGLCALQGEGSRFLPYSLQAFCEYGECKWRAKRGVISLCLLQVQEAF